jgi:FkbM family methyltransferase
MSLRQAFLPLIPPSILSGLQHFKAELSIRRFSPRLVHHDYGDHRLTIHLHDPMSAAWYDCDWKEPLELQLLKASTLRSGALVFDIGAHQCVMAMLLAKEVGSSGRVVAVEPNPFNVQIAKLNLESNGFRNVVTIEAMLSNSNDGGFVSFQLNAVASTSAPVGRKVQSMTLEHLVKRFGIPAVIYLDIEGFEADVLREGETMVRLPIDWCVELHGDEILRRHQSSNAMIAELYLANQFRVSVITEEEKIFEVKTKEAVPPERCHIVAIKRPDAGSRKRSSKNRVVAS